MTFVSFVGSSVLMSSSPQPAQWPLAPSWEAYLRSVPSLAALLSYSTPPSYPPPPSPAPAPAPYPSSDYFQPPRSRGLTAGALIGIGVAAAVLALLLVIVVVLAVRSRKRRPGSNANPDKKEEEGKWPPIAPAAPSTSHASSKGTPQMPVESSSDQLRKRRPHESIGWRDCCNKVGTMVWCAPRPQHQGPYTYKELSVATDGFSSANFLGEGAFGYVYKGVLANGKQVAVKRLKTNSQQAERESQAEVEIIGRVNHRHLVSLLGYCFLEDKRLLVYDFVPNNTLAFHLHGRGRPTMEWSKRVRVAIGAAKGIAYLHDECQPRIVHRDIKASNIFLDFEFNAKVADFGLAKSFPDEGTHVTSGVMGTRGYFAPEYLISQRITEKSDVYSFGVVLLELITGQDPVVNKDTTDAISLADWARPLLELALKDDGYDRLVDIRLGGNYGVDEMARMAACAAACIRIPPKKRPVMTQIVRILDGGAFIEEHNADVQHGRGSSYTAHLERGSGLGSGARRPDVILEYAEDHSETSMNVHDQEIGRTSAEISEH